MNTRAAEGKKTKRKFSWWKLLVGFLIAILVIALTAAAIFYILYQRGRGQLLTTETAVEVTAPSLEDAEIVVEDQGQRVHYNGKEYVLNENVTSVLLIGIDKAFDVERDVVGEGGQADALYLATVDVKTGRVNVLGISRDSMVDVDLYDANGDYVGKSHIQVCLSYAYGDGRETSCENTVRAVSRLLYGVPINSYAAVDLDALPVLNDAVGGVEVEIFDKYVSYVFGFEGELGETVKLEGDKARLYIQARNLDSDFSTLDSNNDRMARQKYFMLQFAKKALAETKEDVTVPLKLFNTISDYMVTNLNASRISYLASLVTKVGFGEDSMITIPGEVVKGENGYAQYIVDEKALYEIVLDVFYTEVK